MTDNDMVLCTRCGTNITPIHLQYFRLLGVLDGTGSLPYCLSCKQVLDNPRPTSPDCRGGEKVWPRNTRCYHNAVVRFMRERGRRVK